MPSQYIFHLFKINRFGFSNKVWDYSPVGQAPPGSVITLEVGPF